MRWMTEAHSLIGTREVPGAGNNPVIMSWGNKLGARVLGIAYGADSVPWCGLFAAHCVTQAGLKPPSIAIRAKAWASWGEGLSLVATRPPLGAVAVFSRDGGGHIGFVDSVNRDGSFNILGGNQGDAVSLRRLRGTHIQGRAAAAARNLRGDRGPCDVARAGCDRRPRRLSG